MNQISRPFPVLSHGSGLTGAPLNKKKCGILVNNRESWHAERIARDPFRKAIQVLRCATRPITHTQKPVFPWDKGQEIQHEKSVSTQDLTCGRHTSDAYLTTLHRALAYQHARQRKNWWMIGF